MNEIHTQAVYDRRSFSNPLTSTVHGRPECPACSTGRLRLWHVGMTHDGGFVPAGHEPIHPAPTEPPYRYDAVLMVCRDRYDDKPGCGFSLPVVDVHIVDLNHMRAIAEHVEQSTSSARPDQHTD